MGMRIPGRAGPFIPCRTPPVYWGLVARIGVIYGHSLTVANGSGDMRLKYTNLSAVNNAGRMDGARGFSLIELMVTIAVLAIVLAMAVPSFTALINGNRLSSQANDITAALQLARMDAIRFNRRSVLCRSTNGTSCNAANGAWTGWLSYVDTDGDGAPSAAEIQRSGSINASVTLLPSAAISGNSNQIVFHADGLARSGAGTLLQGALAICMATTRPADNERIVSLASGSRTAIMSSNGAGACNAPADSPVSGG